MKKIFVLTALIGSSLSFISCTDEAKTLSGMYPPVPAGAEIFPHDDESGLVSVAVYAPDGSITEQGDYRDNLREGVYTQYHSNGLVKVVCGYVGGLKQGQEITMDDRGTVEARATYHQGELHGASVVYLRNRIKEKKNFLNGVLNGELQKFYPNGTLMERSNYVDGQLDGVANWYDQQGNKTIEYTYSMGKLVQDEE